MSQRQVADRSGLSISLISQVELGKPGFDDPRKSTIARLADALDVPAPWLAFENGPEPEWGDVEQQTTAS